MKRLLLLLTPLLFLSISLSAQVGQSTRDWKGNSEPSGSCTVGVPPVHYNGTDYFCDSGTWGRNVRKPVYTVAGLPTCNAARVNQTVDVSDGNRAPRTCRNTDGSNYRWVDEDAGEYKVERFGAVCAPGVDDTIPINLAISTAIAENASYPGAIVRLPKRKCIADVVITEGRGVTLKGHGPHSTQLQAYTSGSSTIKVNGMWRSRIEDMEVLPNGTLSGKAILEIDGNYDGTHTLGVQGNVFSNLYVGAGGSSADYAISMCRQGGDSGQCSENLFQSVNANGAAAYGYYQTGYNALNNTFIGGNFAGNRQSVYVAKGSVIFKSVGFQGYTVGLRRHIDNGPEITLVNGADDISTFENNRFESLNILDSGSAQIVGFANNNIITGVVPAWQASHAYAQGDIIKGVTGAGGNGKVYVAMTAGTTGGTEPTWPASNVAYGLTGGNITATDKTFDCTACGVLYAGIVLNGMGIVIDGAGTSGGAHYSTMDTRTDNSTWEINNAAVTTVANKAYHIGATVADGGVTWMQYEYDEFKVAKAGSFDKVQMGFGRFNVGSGNVYQNSGFLEIKNATIAREDWLTGVALNYPNNDITFENIKLRLNGGINSGSAASPYYIGFRNGGPALSTFTSPFVIGGKSIVGTGGTGGTNEAPVVIAPDTANARWNVTGGWYPDATGYALGSTTKAWKDLFIYGSGTFGSHSFKLTGTPTGHRTVIFPDDSITVARIDAPQTFTGNQNFAGQVNINNGQRITVGTGIGIFAGEVDLGSASTFNWSSSGAYNGTLDTGLARNAAGILEVNNGTPSTYRDLKIRSLLLQNTGTATATAGAATSNVQVGTITSESLTTAAGATYTLTLTNSLISSSSRIFVSFTDDTNTQGTLELGKVTPSSGSATIVIRNTHATEALNGTIKINFFVL